MSIGSPDLLYLRPCCCESWEQWQSDLFVETNQASLLSKRPSAHSKPGRSQAALFSILLIQSAFCLQLKRPAFNTMSGYTILIVMAIMAGVAFAGFSVVPKGENQTYGLLSIRAIALIRSAAYRVIRTMICLTITCCTVMWAITYLVRCLLLSIGLCSPGSQSQLHPLVCTSRQALAVAFPSDSDCTAPKNSKLRSHSELSL